MNRSRSGAAFRHRPSQPLARGVLTVGGAKVVSADVVAGNGVIHVVDSVILPSKN